MPEKIFFGFALANGMFVGNCEIRRRVLDVEEAKRIIDQGVESCLNRFHTATVDAMHQRFDIKVDIPETPLNVLLKTGDSILVMGIQGLPRLTGDRRHYTDEEVALATFEFVLYTIV